MMDADVKIPDSAAPSSVVFRTPRRADGAAIHRLIAQCPPLDLNSVYAYLLLCEHHRDTCVVAETDGGIAGFVSAYAPPGRGDTIFIWQVAVHDRARGRRLAGSMLDHLLGRPARHGYRRADGATCRRGQSAAQRRQCLPHRADVVFPRQSRRTGTTRRRCKLHAGAIGKQRRQRAGEWPVQA